jgi:hypothetical protein
MATPGQPTLYKPEYCERSHSYCTTLYKGAMRPSEVPDWRIACGNCGNWLALIPQVRWLRLDDARGAREGPTAFCCHRARSPYGGKVLFCSAMTPAPCACARARGRAARCINHDNPSLDVPEQCCGLSLPTLTQRFGGMFIQFDGSTAERAGQAMKIPAGSAGFSVGRRGARKRWRLSAGDQCSGHQCFRRPICWERATARGVISALSGAFVNPTAHERHWSGALPAMSHIACGNCGNPRRRAGTGAGKANQMAARLDAAGESMRHAAE